MPVPRTFAVLQKEALRKMDYGRIIEGVAEEGEHALGALPTRAVSEHGSYVSGGKTFTGQNPVAQVRTKWGYKTTTGKVLSGEVDPGKRVSYVSGGKTYTSYSTNPGFKKSADQAILDALNARLSQSA